MGMNEFEIRDELQEKRRSIKTFDDLIAFLKQIEDIDFDSMDLGDAYGVAPRSIAQAALATAQYLSCKFGITGFQSGFVMWDFIKDWSYSHNKCGLRLVNMDDMLYPQYNYKFDKTISSDTWAALQKEAKSKLENRKDAHPAVIAHWKSIVNGDVPFGYTVSDE